MLRMINHLSGQILLVIFLVAILSGGLWVLYRATKEVIEWLFGKSRRSRFLDSFRNASIETVVRTAENICILNGPANNIEIRRIKLSRLTMRRYRAVSLGLFVSSLLHQYPSIENYEAVSRAMMNCSRRYRNLFVNATSRHADVNTRLFNMVLGLKMAEEIKRDTAKEAVRIERGVKLCNK